eukprot:TRINITY_DN6893_c0_g2_i1.p1 TRINITY_DN6893_c0_g2~~TRINITY_DN6893_c0_g2_i1.p1  ORF type:complete len:195 (+),score=29.56 TRINITY_DN6893_c0_g2_i1:64-648(+)
MCIRDRLFMIINEKLNKIKKAKQNTSTGSVSTYKNVFQNRGVTYASYSYNQEENNNTANQNGVDFKVMVDPCQLEGINSLWDFIMNSQLDGVTEKAIEFLCGLYLDLDTEIEKHISQIRMEYLDKCRSLLNQILSQQSNYSENQFAQKVVVCLNLIASILDESEKLGIGSLKSHCSLVNGELMAINLNLSLIHI